MSEPLEALITIVVPAKDSENDVELEIRNIGDVLEFYLDGKKIFSGDWFGNFQQVFKRALELWGEKDGV